MGVIQRNNGEKTEDGSYVTEIDTEDGAPVQIYRAKTRKELNELVANAQFNGSRTIHQLKSERQPGPGAGNPAHCAEAIDGGRAFADQHRDYGPGEGGRGCEATGGERCG